MANQAFEMKITGVEQTLKTFRNYFDDVDISPFIIDAMTSIGKVVEVEAKLLLNEKIYNTPQKGGYVRTGLLRARTTGDNGKAQGSDKVAVVVRSQQYYAVYIEFGIRNMQPRAFLLPAAQAKSDEALQILNKALDKFLRAKVVK